MNALAKDTVRGMTSLRDAVNHLFEESFVRPGDGWLTTFREGPAIDMYETDGVVKVETPLPGVKAEEVDISISGKTLTIQGETKAKEEVKEENYHRREMRYGAFTRMVALPENVDTEKPEATMADGMLTITFPKLSETEPRKVTVKT